MKNWMLILGLMVCTATFGQRWHKDHDAAFSEASRNCKQVLLLFSLPDACDPCDRLEKTVIASEAFDSFADQTYVLARPDFGEATDFETKANNLLIVEKYNKDGFFPWVVILDPNGKVLGKMGQYNDESPETYIAKLRAVTRH